MRPASPKPPQIRSTNTPWPFDGAHRSCTIPGADRDEPDGPGRWGGVQLVLRQDARSARGAPQTGLRQVEIDEDPVLRHEVDRVRGGIEILARPPADRELEGGLALDAHTARAAAELGPSDPCPVPVLLRAEVRGLEVV